MLKNKKELFKIIELYNLKNKLYSLGFNEDNYNTTKCLYIIEKLTGIDFIWEL